MLDRSGIYSITHTSGRKYIGSAANLRIRWTWHRNALDANKHHSQKLQRAWNKYGSDTFVFSVVEYVDDCSKLIEREQVYLNSFSSIRDSFNICSVAGNTSGRRHSYQARAKIAAMATGRKASVRTREKMSLARRGIKRGPMSEEQKRKLSIAKTGKTASDETKKKMSDARMGKKLSPEHAAKLKSICRMMTERSMSPESKAKMGVAAKRRMKRAIRDEKGRILAFDAEQDPPIEWSDPTVVPLSAYL